MKLKYKVAVKFFTETKNQEQLNYAYKEIESFTENFNKFKWYYKFNTERIKNKYGLNIFEESQIDPKIETLLQNKESEFVRFLHRYKLKVADNIFQRGNYNIDLVKYAIEKVIKKEKQTHDEGIDINTILNSDLGSPNHQLNINEQTSSNVSLLISLVFVLLSIGLIFMHYYMYMKNPTKFFNGFQGKVE